MESFSSILSSLENKSRRPQQPSSDAQKPNQTGQPIRNPNNITNGTSVRPNNAAAGVKRRSEEPELGPRPKSAKIEPDRASHSLDANTTTANRFQLSARPSTASKTSTLPNRPVSKPATSSSNPQKAVPQPVPKAINATPVSPSAANGPAPAPKRGFASVMEKAKAAQEAAKVAGSTSIKHKAAEKMTKRERLRSLEEAKAQQKTSKSGKATQGDSSGGDKPGTDKAAQVTNSSIGIGKAPIPLAYQGTMRTAASTRDKSKKRAEAQGQDKYGGYASWSDLSDAEDEPEDDYDSEASSDMEGGFDDVEEEEALALREAKKEDQDAAVEEERHRREKEQRKRKLLELSKTAAAKKKF